MQFIGPALLQIRGMCCQVSDVRLISIDKGKTCQLDSFRYANFFHLSIVKKRLLDFYSSLTDIVHEACRWASCLVCGLGLIPDVESHLVRKRV